MGVMVGYASCLSGWHSSSSPLGYSAEILFSALWFTVSRVVVMACTVVTRV